MLAGFPREDARWGARNHVLVLPSVVCAGWTAEAIGQGLDAVPVVHQHGCAHVGDDVVSTERAFLGFSTNPNVGGVVVVSLGCETIQGRRVAGEIEDLGQRLEFTGIQAAGGTAAAVAEGRDAVARLRDRLDREERVAAPDSALLLGIEAHPSLDPRRVEELGRLALEAGAGAVLALWPGQEPPGGPWAEARDLLYAERAEPGLSVIWNAGEGAEQHVGLAGAGAQVVVTLCGPGHPAVGCAVCPVLAVAGDRELYQALADDFDLGPEATAAEIWAAAQEVFSGRQTASELRGSRDFSLRRLARTM
jgi:altronate dehydratase large subunit